MQFTISKLNPSDIDRVDDLMKRNSRTLGFLPRAALGDYLNRGSVLGANSDSGCLAGYLLYGSYPDRFRIAHLCISESFRGRGLAKRLVEELKSRCTTQCVIRLNCRRDYEAHHLWPRLGFIPVDEKPGRSLDGHPLTSWELRIREDSQLDIFRESASDQAIDVVIDSHILFHLHAPESPESKPSRALLADFLADLIRIRLTDEVFLEIDRHSDPTIRQTSRGFAELYPRVISDPKLVKGHEKSLNILLKPRTDSDKSDVRHLAETAASEIEIFVTRDEKILRRSRQIRHLIQVEVVSPIDLVIRLHEFLDKDSYKRSAISGQNLAWRRARAADTGKLVDALLQPGEVKGKLREILYGHLSQPYAYRFDVLFRQEQILGARVSTTDDDRMTVSFIRTAKSNNQRLLNRFLVSDALTECVAQGYKAIRLKQDGLPNGMEKDLLEMGFRKSNSNYERLCLTGVMTRIEVNDEANRLFPNISTEWNKLSDQEVLTLCSPLALRGGNESGFIVPIKPAYAMSLFDKQVAGDDLFGGRSHVLMRWANAYFRTKSHHRILAPPARILWYESGKVGAITATSHLQSVEIGPPKYLFRKFRKFGTLDWNDVFTICHGDTTREIMALEFSHTFALRRPVTLGDLRTMENRQSVPLQSPRRICGAQLLRIMEMGYAEATK